MVMIQDMFIPEDENIPIFDALLRCDNFNSDLKNAIRFGKMSNQRPLLFLVLKSGIFIT